MRAERATKLVCTLGPSSLALVRELVEAGMDVARINLSHGDPEEWSQMVKAVREASSAVGRPVGVLADLPGPKVRLGELASGEVRLEAGARFVLLADGSIGDASAATTTHPGLAADLEPGDRVLLADGAVELRVEESVGEVVTTVVRGGRVRSRAGVNVPSERLSTPAITERDREGLASALRAGADAVAQSFVRRAEEVRSLRTLLGERPPLLVAKIETRAAVDDVDAVLEASDAIMVARGDLGVECDLEEIPVIQRDLVRRANRAGVPVLIATQMLESMTRAPRPTRAEASDVAGAVFEGADAILLSAETAIGEFPVESARTADRIVRVAEWSRFLPAVELTPAETDAEAVAQAAAGICRGGGVVAVACFTRTGRTAALLSAARPRVQVHAFSPSEPVTRRLTLYHGVSPFLSELPPDTDALIAMMDRRLRDRGAARPGDAVVMVASSPVGYANTNLLKVHRIAA